VLRVFKASLKIHGASHSRGEPEVENAPPCISRLVSDVKAGRKVPFLGRIATASFLLKSGRKPVEVAEVFRSQSNFKDALALYQAEHIAGSRIAPPSCEALKKHGLCPVPSGLCRHPLNKL